MAFGHLRLIGLACGAALSLLYPPAIGAAQPATPAPEAGKSLVVLGDSYSANGDIAEILAPSMDSANGTDPKSCEHSPTSWPVQLTRLMGVPPADVVNESCTGATLSTGPGYVANQEAKQAVQAGAFGPRTRLVAIQLGMNDLWGKNGVRFSQLESCLLDMINGCDSNVVRQGRATDPAEVTGAAYAARIHEVVDYVRYYAPNARIAFIGYPELHAQGSRQICLDTLGGRVTQSRAGAWTAYLDALDAAQRAAARSLNVEFFDTGAVTAGHGTCAADPWVNGLFSTREELNGETWHPTAHGDATVAAAMRRWVG